MSLLPSSPIHSALAVADALAQRLAASAAARDQAGGHPAQERQWLRDSGLLTLSVPAACGGQGAPWRVVLEVVRILARADAALAHLFGFHHLQLAGLTLYGSEEQRERLLALSVSEHIFWGNALNPLDRRVQARPDAERGGFVLDGIKSFSSGSVGADWLTVSAWDAASNSALIGVLPTDAPGVRVEADWDAFGQRQTDSGNVHFTTVFLPLDLVLQQPGTTPTPQATLR